MTSTAVADSTEKSTLRSSQDSRPARAPHAGSSTLIDSLPLLLAGLHAFQSMAPDVGQYLSIKTLARSLTTSLPKFN